MSTDKNKLIPELRFPEFVDELKKIGFSELGEIKIGLTHKPDYIKSGIAFLSSKNISSGYIDFINIKYISQEKFKSMPASTKPKLGDILFTRVGSNLGNPIILEEDRIFGIFVSLGIFRVNKRAHNFYIKYWMESDLFWKQVKQKVAGGAKDNLNTTWLKEFELFIPPIKEQQKIASCLSSLDEVIAAHSQKLATLKDHKKGLMQNLFPQEGETVPNYRFPEFTDELKKIGFSELGEIKIGLTHKPDYIKSGIAFLSSKNISSGYIDFINIKYISQGKFKSMPASTKPKLGDILFTRVGSNLGNPIILEEDRIFGIFVSLGIFRVNKKAHNFYIKYWMESDLFWKQVKQKVAGGAKDNLNTTWLKEFELFIPPITEQQKIASCLSSLNDLITAQAEKIAQLKLHKKGLMQGFFP